MIKNDSNNPFEELQNQLKDLLKGQNVTINPAIFPSDTSDSAPKPSEPEDPKSASVETIEDPLQQIRDFSLKPKEIVDYLNKYVIEQNEAKKVLSVAICDHYNHVRQCVENPDIQESEYSKQNILLLGPTGVGKTYLMRTIAQLIGVPFIKADATKFSETGYVGSDVEDLVRDLTKSAKGNTELAEYGIVYVDEIDKIANSSSQGGGKDVSGRGVQINLLKLMEDTEVNLFNPTDMMSQMQAMMEMSRGSGGKPKKKTISTKHILFIVSGAFDKLAEDVQKRLHSSKIGFAGTAKPDEEEDICKYLHSAETTDFIDYGFEPEFVGRLPVRVACESLTASNLASILKNSEGSILKQYSNDFKGYDIKLSLSPEAIDTIAKKAHSEKTGARGLMTVFEKVFRDFKYELPSTAIKALDVTSKTVNDPSAELKQLLKDNIHLQSEVLKEDIERFIKDFNQKHGFTLSFNQEASLAIVEESIKSEKTIRSICLDKFKDYEHGLKIISRNSGDQVFEITKANIESPDKELSRWVVKSFNDEKETSVEEI